MPLLLGVESITTAAGQCNNNSGRSNNSSNSSAVAAAAAIGDAFSISARNVLTKSHLTVGQNKIKVTFSFIPRND